MDVVGVLEFAPIVVAVGILAIWHPSKYVEPVTGEERIKDEVEMSAAGKGDSQV